ncbi:putative ACR [compost metagenome]
MQGYLVTFFTQQSRRHGGKPITDWMVDLAKSMKLKGATLVLGSEGFGHAGRLHSYHFFELADQPVEICLAVSAEECDQLFERLEAEEIALFYVKTPVEMGVVGKRKADRDTPAS